MTDKELAKTCALIQEALKMIHECMKVYVEQTEKLNKANREAIGELRSRMVPTPREIIGGGK